jgi:DNA-binding IclR family transcriptional regulator
MLKTIRYAGAILELFTASRPSWRLRQIAEALALPPSSTHGLVSSLVEAGLLASPSRGLYEVNWQVLQLASLIGREDDLVAAAEPVLSRLSSSAGVGTQLVVLERWRARCVYIRPCGDVLQVALPVPGESFAAHTSAAGKALLSVRPYAVVRQFIHILASPTDSQENLVDLGHLERELADVREYGFSVDAGGHVEGICCLAAPVHSSAVDGCAAVCAVVPGCRFERLRDELECAVVAAAHELTGLLSRG